MITFKKIDRRYNGGNIYQYMLLVNVSLGPSSEVRAIKEFNELRKWCESIWGYS